MTAQRRPKRQRKSDRLINPGAGKVEIMVDHAVAPFDRAARAMEQKWGYDRLPELVSPELAAKYGAAVGHLNDCIAENDPDKTAAAAANCVKGLAAMDAAATAANAPLPGTLAEYDLDGFAFGIIEDAAHQVAIQRDGVKLFTLREIAIALQAQYGEQVSAVKAAFPKATVTNIKTREPVTDWKRGDDIPF